MRDPRQSSTFGFLPPKIDHRKKPKELDFKPTHKDKDNDKRKILI